VINETKFLGITMDAQLTWSSHVNAINNNLKQYIGVLYKRKDFLTSTTRKMLYFALVHSKLVYGIEIYGTAKSSVLNPVRVSVNRILRILQNGNRHTQVKFLYENYTTLPIFQLFQYSVGNLMFKCLTDTCFSVSLRNILVLSNNANRHYTRSSGTNSLFRSNVTSYLQSLSYLYCTIWNNICHDIRQATTLKKFKKLYKQHLLQTI